MGSHRCPRLPKVRFLSHFGLLLGALGEPVWGHFAPRFPNRRDYVDFLVPFFRSRKKERKRGSPGGGDMRSAHAGACFVRVGPRRFGSVLGSILESFWEPSAPLCSLWVARVTKTGSQKRGSKNKKSWWNLGCRAGGGGEGVGYIKRGAQLPSRTLPKTIQKVENNRKAIQGRKQREESANTRRSPCYAGSADI